MSPSPGDLPNFSQPPSPVLTGLAAMEGAEQIEQDPHLPFCAHYTSINAAWAPADPCEECLLSYSLLSSMITSLFLGLSTPPVSLPGFWGVISLASSL